MHRRDALKTMNAALAAFILPSPRRHIDLMQFCGNQDWSKYNLALPYELQDWTYATDAKICVRVRPQLGDTVQRHGKIPPFESLSWNHDQLRGWRSLPCREPIMASDSDCPTCQGYGHTPAIPGKECDHCEGMGQFLDSSVYSNHAWDCDECGGSGHIMPPGCITCPTCNGDVIGNFPSIVEIDGRYYDASLYAKARSLGAEFVQDIWESRTYKGESLPLIKFRFDGGHGMMIGLDHVQSVKRIVAARDH